MKLLRSRDFREVPDEFGAMMQILIVRFWEADQRKRPSFDVALQALQAAGLRILPNADGQIPQEMCEVGV
jgi:hypothetical protein